MFEQYRTATFSPRHVSLASLIAVACLFSGCIFGSQGGGDDTRSDAIDSDAADTQLADTVDASDTADASDDADTSEMSDTDDAVDTSEDAATDAAGDGSEDDCLDSQTFCSGTCVDLQTSPAHCGQCNHACDPPANATASCEASECVFACKSAFADLDGDLQEPDSNGCEGECAANGTELYYLDADEDGYGRPGTGQRFCIGEQGAGRVANDRDCDDNDALVNPEGTFQDQPRTDGSYDYDCDGAIQKEFPNGGTCSDPLLGSCSYSAGWDGDVPDCGSTGDYLTDCCGGEETATYTQSCR
jgi:hypothetical protein